MAKIIDRWELMVRTGSEAEGGKVQTPVTVPVKMDQRGGQTIFLVDFQYGEQHLQDRDRDIDALRARTIQWLQGVVSYRWEDYLYVELHAGDDKRQLGDERTVSLSLSRKCYQVARNHLGDQVYRDLSRTMNQGRITEWPPRENGLLIEKTPENEAVLDKLFAGLASLAEHLTGVVGPFTAADLWPVLVEQLLDRPLRAETTVPKSRKRKPRGD